MSAKTTAVSFDTNTNWQNYGGETTLSYFGQMAGLTVHLFVSAAAGMAAAVARIRAFARRSARTVASGKPRARATVQALVARHTTGRTFDLLGERRVNVLELNAALDARR